MKFVSVLALVLLGQSCATYHHAQKVKMVAFSDNLSKGQSAGMIRGEDCTWTVLGHKLGGDPTLDKAFLNTQNQSSELESAGFASKDASKALRYVNNVATENSGFNAVVVGKQCLIVKGMGYK